MTYVIRLIERYNPPVPNFDRNDRPDLLGWDAAMASYVPDSTILATAHDKDDGALIASALADEYDNEEEGTFVTSGKIDGAQEEKPYTLKDWWEDHGEKFCELDYYNLTEFDQDGKPYKWDDDNVLFTQVPSYHDFMAIMAHRAAAKVFYCNNNLEDSPESKRAWDRHEVENLWKLHDKLYETDYPWTDLSRVSADITIKVTGAGK